MVELPKKYEDEMKELLGDEFEAYLACFDMPFHRSLRVNTAKISVEEFLLKFPYRLDPVPWNDTGFYFYDEGVTTHPYWFAGLYYIQEASASFPGNVLPIEPGDKVLDLCAAPGGKSTQLSAKLNGTGILVSNDYSVSRSQVLLRNLERAGSKNCYVTSEDPKKMVQYFPEYFDKILVDAPCSGEGMFRKDHSLITSWMQKDSSYYVPIQKDIVESAWKMLRPGGMMVYSTCTFSRLEDEEIIQHVLNLDANAKVIPISQYEGFVSNTFGTKLFPHRVKGEGHFVSLIQKGEKVNKEYQVRFDKFTEEGMTVYVDHAVRKRIGDKVYAYGQVDVDLKGLRVLRSGLLLGEEKKNRFEPSVTLALAMRKEGAGNVVSFSVEDERVMRYLKGETVDAKDTSVKDGWVLICVDDYPLGFAKASKGILKNKYPKGWVYQGK